MITYHPSTVGHGGIQSLSQPGTIGNAQDGAMGMQMGGSHAQHGVEIGSSGILHMPPSVSVCVYMYICMFISTSSFPVSIFLSLSLLSFSLPPPPPLDG